MILTILFIFMYCVIGFFFVLISNCTLGKKPSRVEDVACFLLWPFILVGLAFGLIFSAFDRK